MGMYEYSSAIIPVFTALSSLGIFYPYIIEQVIIFSFILVVVLFLLGAFFEKIRLRGYYDILLASISIIFALAYFQKATVYFIISGILVLAFAIYTISAATMEIKCAY